MAAETRLAANSTTRKFMIINILQALNVHIVFYVVVVILILIFMLILILIIVILPLILVFSHWLHSTFALCRRLDSTSACVMHHF